MDDTRPSKSSKSPASRLSADLMLVGIMGLFGCLAIYSATFHMAQPWFFAVRQFSWLVIGMVTLAVCSRLPRHVYTQWTLPASGVMLTLLYAVLIFGAPPHNGMRGWFAFNIPAIGEYYKDIHIQPSELGKPVFVLFMAWLLSRPVSGGRDIGWPQYAQALGVAALWFVPIALQPDFGTLLIYVLAFAVIYWLRGGKTLHLGLSALVGIPVVWGISRAHPYVGRRIASFLDPEAHADGSAWHVMQNLAALASGGWLGQSLDKESLSRNYVPQAHSDSIFATLGENLGFVGVLVLLVGLTVWLVRIVGQARDQTSLRDALVVAGIAAMIGAQAFVHISVTLGMLPPTGVTLPFFSYGGSSLVATCAALGMVISFRRGETVSRSA